MPHNCKDYTAIKRAVSDEYVTEITYCIECNKTLHISTKLKNKRPVIG